jgi:hypothetical protein
MACPKTAKPAREDSAEPVSKSDQLAREIDPTNNPSPAQLQAPDDAGESDREFFGRRPHVNSRKRLAFDNEPPPGVLERDEYENIAFISVRVKRDAAGLPATIFRAAIYGRWGHA